MGNAADSISEAGAASLVETCRRIKSRQWRARDLTERVLEQIQARDGALHSFARLRTEQALATASALDAAQDDGAPLGLLHGVPLAVKDLFFLRGEIAASGTTLMGAYRPDETATVVRRLQQAGAVIVGQTQLTEGAFGLHHPEVTAPRNPWHADYWTGVSSSGSAVAVAAGLVCAALGTDTGGSIRFPSACCGLVGLKPTYGRVSRHGIWPLAPSMDHIGPMARSVADVARLYQVIAGYDDQDPTTSTLEVGSVTSLAPRDLRGLRVGLDWDYGSIGVADSVVTTVRRVAALLGDQGARLVEVTLPPQARTLTACWSETCGVEAAAAHRAFYPERRSEYGPALRSLIDLGLATGTLRYRSLEAIRNKFRLALDLLFEDVDILLLPTMPGPVPLRVEAEGMRGGEAGRADYLTFTAPFNYSGHPTLTLPAGLESLSSRGRIRLPRSCQLIGPRLGEAALLQIGMALEPLLAMTFGAMVYPC